MDKEEKDQLSIPFFAHEDAMMHKDLDNKRLLQAIIMICITFIFIISIFVTSYNVRTANWLKTISDMNAAIVEVVNGVHQQPD